MPAPTIPQPIPFDAVCLRFGEYNLLARGAEAVALGTPLFGPPVYLHFALRHVAGSEAVIPALVVDDRGNEYRADVYDWIEARAYAFPRADVFGVGPDGAPRTVFMKELDLALPPQAFAARAPDEFPGERISLALEIASAPGGLALAPSANFPERLLRAVPAYCLDPALVGAVGAGLIASLLATGRRDWRLAWDDLEDTVEL